MGAGWTASQDFGKRAFMGTDKVFAVAGARLAGTDAGGRIRLDNCKGDVFLRKQRLRVEQ